jgi:adenine-specific DNA-methyltransferase
MARKPKLEKKPIEQYAHPDKKRVNNPPVGLVTAETDRDSGKKTYAYDPHLDPALQWAGKAEHTSFEVPTVSLHVHERIDSRTILEAVRKRNGTLHQVSLFEQSSENPPLREAIEFYKHRHNWSNRLLAGDSLLVMNSLLEKEGMGGKVQMVYFDPPYGIKYGSNFQPFVNKRDVKDGKDEDLTAEPEMIKAFRDTWELGVHSYLTYLRDRLLLARELLHESGSVFVQISEDNLHHLRELMDEVFGASNFVSMIYFVTTGGFSTGALSRVGDYIVWYGKDRSRLKYRQLYVEKELREGGGWAHSHAEFEDGNRRSIGVDEVRRLLSEGRKIRPYSLDGLSSQGVTATSSDPYDFEDQLYNLPANSHWKTNPDGMKRLGWARRIEASTNSIRFVRFLDDFPVQPITNVWDDTNRPGYIDEKRFVVQTSSKVIERCVLMTTDPGDLIFDPTCGSGTTAFVAEQWGRRWTTCDTSRVAVTLAKQRLMTSLFTYNQLARHDEGVGSGFVYKTVPHVTLKSIANNPEIHAGLPREQIDRAIARYAEQETLYDQPVPDNNKVRVTGPFTVEAVPAPIVESLQDIELDNGAPADDSISRSGETLRQAEWRDELYKTGIRGKGGQTIEFVRVEPLPGTRFLHAVAETKDAQRVAVTFGPEHAPLEQRQVEMAIEEAARLVPKPKVIVFAAFQFDPEAAKDIEETNFPGVTLLKAQMSADLLTDDLKKKRASNESFWLIGQPDVRVRKITSGDAKGKHTVEVLGFDYYDTKSGTIVSGGTAQIAMWMLDTDYDGRSVYPHQVFFPMAGDKDGWARLAKSLNAEIDQDLIAGYRGHVSLPFASGKHNRVAVKIIDDRGIESLKIVAVE